MIKPWNLHRRKTKNFNYNKKNIKKMLTKVNLYWSSAQRCGFGQRFLDVR
jgi:hypothetical protein